MVAFDALDLDVGRWQQVYDEQRILEAIIPVSIEIPESSFLDLLVALSLLPMAIFTTMAVLGGGEQDIPRWMIGTNANWTGGEDEEESVGALPAPGEGVGEAKGSDAHLTEDEIGLEENTKEEPTPFEEKIVQLAQQLDSLDNDNHSSSSDL
jgi:hypothetical protein